jgi:hypothetical protein
MKPDDELNRAVPVPMHVLPEVVCDMTGGRGVDPDMNRAVPVPTAILPEAVFAMPQPAVLTVTLSLKPGADVGHAIVDGATLIEALSRYERELGGQGLHPVPSEPTEPDRVRIVLNPAAPNGAADRLAKLAAAINQGDPAVPREVLTGRSFVACTAELPPAA